MAEKRVLMCLKQTKIMVYFLRAGRGTHFQNKHMCTTQ